MARILLIDGEPRAAGVVAAVLSGRGHDVRQVQSAESAGPVLEGARGDLVVLGGALPVGIGLGIARRAASLGVPAAVVTAPGDRARIEEVVRALGAASVLEHPGDLLGLADAIEARLPYDAVSGATDFEAELRALRVDYARTLPSKLDEILRAVATWRAAPGDVEHQRRVRVLAHRLKGTAGSYGFAEVSEAAGALEQRLANVAADATDVDAALAGLRATLPTDLRALAPQAA